MKHRKNTKQNTAKAPNDLQNRQEGGFISYYHDRYDLEADAVLHLDDGRYALIEFKLGSREIEEAKYKRFSSPRPLIPWRTLASLSVR